MTAATSHGPSAKIEASELFLRLSETPRPVSDPLDFPEKDKKTGKPIGQYRLTVLTEHQLHYVRAQADIAARQIMGKMAPKNGETSLGYEDIYRNELSVQLAALACRSVDTPHTMPVFMSAKDARARLDSDQFGVICRAYNLFRLDVGPELAELTTEECDAWIDRLKEGGQRHPLSRLTLEALTDLLLHSAARLRQLEANGSSGSPAGGSSTETPASLENGAHEASTSE